MNLAWDLKDLEDLMEEERLLLAEVDTLRDVLSSDASDGDSNVPRRLAALRKRLTLMTKGLSRHKRTAATHVFVFMISTEDRAKKPYALPIQCIPYKGLSHKMIRHLTDRVVAEMTVRGMKVVGKMNVTNSLHGTSLHVQCIFIFSLMQFYECA